MSSYKLGIDFGTSNSTCAFLDGDNAQLIPLEGDSTTLPSAMFFGADGHIYFGKKAFVAYLDGEEGRFMRGLKSILGTSLMKERTLINRKSLDFVQIITIYIHHIKACAEQYIGSQIKDVVIGRPVHFHDNNPEADAQSEQTLQQISESIGFENISFQYEPIAAAFAHEKTLQKEQLALVVDLGGGTSDFTVIRLSPQSHAQANRSHDIFSTSGVRIGGTNFDQKLSMRSFMPHLGLGSTYASEMDASKILPIPPAVYHQLSDWPQVHFGQTKKAIRETKALIRTAADPEKMKKLLALQEAGLGHALLQAAEQTKISLTKNDSVTADFSDVDLGFDVTVSRTEFEEAIHVLILGISTSMDECIASAGVEKDAIGLVILTGGSSELPIVNQLVTNKFPSAKISNDNKFGSVGLGLAYNTKYAFSS